jgi:hypothetical protein
VPTARTDLLVGRTQRIVLTGDIPQLHSEQLYGLHSSPNVIRVTKSIRIAWAGHVARVRVRRRAYKGLVGRPDAKRRFGKPMLWREYNIKMDLEKLGWGGTDCIVLFLPFFEITKYTCTVPRNNWLQRSPCTNATLAVLFTVMFRYPPSALC